MSRSISLLVATILATGCARQDVRDEGLTSSLDASAGRELYENAEAVRNFMETDEKPQKVIFLRSNELSLSGEHSRETEQVVATAIAAGLGGLIVGFTLGRLSKRPANMTAPGKRVDTVAPVRDRLSTDPADMTAPGKGLDRGELSMRDKSVPVRSDPAGVQMDYKIRHLGGSQSTITYRVEFPEGQVLMRKGEFFEAKNMDEIATHIEDTHQSVWLIVKQDDELFKLGDGDETTKSGLTFRATGQKDPSGKFALLEVRRKGGLLEMTNEDADHFGVHVISEEVVKPTFTRPGRGELKQAHDQLTFVYEGADPNFSASNRFTFGEKVVTETPTSRGGEKNLTLQRDGLVIGRNSSGQIHVLHRGLGVVTKNVGEVGKIQE